MGFAGALEAPAGAASLRLRGLSARVIVANPRGHPIVHQVNRDAPLMLKKSKLRAAADAVHR